MTNKQDYRQLIADLRTCASYKVPCKYCSRIIGDDCAPELKADAADAIETLLNGIKAYQMAAQRNEPMKPIKTDDPFQWHCPRCGSLIGVDGQDEENDYCCDCGQRLDWVADHEKNGG